MYTGVKEFIASYREPFDIVSRSTAKAKKNIKERGEKCTKEELNAEIELVVAEWDKKKQLGENAHTTVHQKELAKNPSAIMGRYVKFDSNEKETGELDALLINKLERGQMYLEKQLVSNHHKLIGWVDKVEVTKDGFINIEDYKSFDKIYRTSSFMVNGYKVPPSFFFSPINNLQHCNYNETCLQISLYMYILWTYNKTLKPGKLYIRHLIISEEGKLIDEKLIEVPYLRKEVKALLTNKKMMNG